MGVLDMEQKVVMTSFLPKVIGAWVLVSVLLLTALWAVSDGIDPDAVPLLVAVVAVLGAGFTAGAVCWSRGHRFTGTMGLLAPVAPVVAHLLAIRFSTDEDVWAPTMVGDLLGLAVGIVGSVVAVIAAIVTRRGAP